MTYKTIAIITTILAIALYIVNSWLQYIQVKQITNTLNTSLKSQKTLVGSNGDALEYTYQQVGKTCYEDIRNGQVISSHCH